MIDEVAKLGGAAINTLAGRKPLSVSDRRVLLLALKPDYKGVSALKNAGMWAAALVKLC